MNEQEKLWHGTFGDAYHVRNGQKNRLMFWMQILGKCDITSALEIGAGQGDNLVALRTLFPTARLAGIEINLTAAEIMAQRGFAAINAPASSSLNLPTYDLVFTRGLLIHLPEDKLEDVFRLAYEKTLRYICFAEYFSTERREVNYRGFSQALFTDDFVSRFMAQYPDTDLVDYGFVYSRDGHDSINWFLMEIKS
jgi:pseudaminic acid biosynthesis-associated methylase